MSAVELTSLVVIAGAVLMTSNVTLAAVLLWNRAGRWRVPVRTVSVLLCEVLTVLSLGLVINRHAQFYPSWQALRGDTGTATGTARRAAGRLDQQLARDQSAAHTAATVAWQPAEAAGWRLSAPARIVVPAGYPTQASTVYPAIVLVGPSDAPPAVPAAVSVTVDPSPQSTVTALSGLPRALARDVRVTDHGWGLVATTAQAPMAVRLARREPGRFTALAVVGPELPAGLRPTPALAVTLIRPAPSQPSAAAAGRAWADATGWAVQQSTAALTSPLILPRVA